MLRLNAILDPDRLARLIEGGYIRRQRHPTQDLFLYNYTARAQYERRWTPETEQCRGLIATGDAQVVARPFPKFWNLEELDPARLPREPFSVYEKLDGSLGILYWAGDQPHLATRGSFTSAQAVVGTRLLARQPDLAARLDRRLTYLFEIIYPENRIVVDYGAAERLVLLAVRETATGRDRPLEEFRALGVELARRYDGIQDLERLRERGADNQEGFVVVFHSGLRVKVKLAEYVRLHRVVTGLTTLHIWEYLREGRALDEILERVPDELYQWVREEEERLRAAYRAIEARSRAAFRDDFPTRREAALHFQQFEYPHILFAMLDGRPYDELIWKLVRPTPGEAYPPASDALVSRVVLRPSPTRPFWIQSSQPATRP